MTTSSPKGTSNNEDVKSTAGSGDSGIPELQCRFAHSSGSISKERRFKMRKTILIKLAAWHVAHPWRMLVISLFLTVVFLGFAGRLTITMRTSDVLPEGDKRVEQFNRIIEEFSTSTSLVIVVQGEESKIKDFADHLAPQILDLRDNSGNEDYRKEIARLQRKIEKLKTGTDKESKISALQSEIEDLQSRIDYKLFGRVDYKAPIEFVKHHGLMLVKEDDLNSTRELFLNPNLTGLITNINNAMEKEYVGQGESISTREKEEGAVSFLDGIQSMVLHLHKATSGDEMSEDEIKASVDKLLFGDPYFISYDKEALILNAIPSFTLMDRDLLMAATISVQFLVDDMLKDYQGVQAGLSGAIAKEHDEQVYAAKSLGYTTLIALIVILVLLMISFRMWAAPLFALLNLVVGLIWASGLAYLAVRQLNMMTSIFSVILMGLGIDFSIHLISGFTEWRAKGDSISDALNKTFLKSGKGILTGGLTTAFAFLALMISQSRGMKEMGLVIGLGLLSVLVTTMVFLPIMLVFKERRVDRKRQKEGKTVIHRDISFHFLGRTSQWLGRRYAFTIVTSIVISIFLIFSALNIGWDYDYRSMEPKGLTSIALIDTVMEKFDLSMDYALVLAGSINESRQLSEKYRDIRSVAVTDDISLFLPSQEEQQARSLHISEIREEIQSVGIKPVILPGDLPTLRSEIERLEMNIMEIQDMAFIGGQDKVDDKCKEIVGDPEAPEARTMMGVLLQALSSDEEKIADGLSFFQRGFAPYYKESVLSMASTDPIVLNELPTSILDRYSNKTRDRFLVTVYPSGSIYDGEFLNRFVDDLERISDKATGMPPLFVALLEIFGRDGRNAILLTLTVVFLLLLADFRSLRSALMAMVPLAMGVFWMVGLMHLTGIPLNIMSVMGLPLIIGIGIDDGVHIIHRWKHEGQGQIQTVFSSTGKAIFLTSLTTMLAFGSMLFSVFPAYGHFGGALFLGVGACFLTSVVILPGIIGVIERRGVTLE